LGKVFGVVLWKSQPDLLKRDLWAGAALLSSNMAHSLRAQTDWLNQPSASCFTSPRSDKSHHIETLLPRYHHIQTVSVPWIRKKKKKKTTSKPI